MNSEQSDHPCELDFGFRIRRGARLPHWTKEGSIYAVTFHLADSIPATARGELNYQRETLLKASELRGSNLTVEERSLIQELFSYRVEQFLHHGRGACWLQMPEIAEMVRDSLLYFQGERYHVLTWCVMPNHVHVILRPEGSFTLDSIIHSWKSFTGKSANKMLNRNGEFWNVEYYDHLIRDEKDLRNQIEYVLNNPMKAGLKSWQWSGYCLEGIQL